MTEKEEVIMFENIPTEDAKKLKQASFAGKPLESDELLKLSITPSWAKAATQLYGGVVYFSSEKGKRAWDHSD